MVILAASLTNKGEDLAMKRRLAMQFINKMALTISASQSDASLLTAIDASIRRMDEDKDASGKQDTTTLNSETDQAKYDTFKKWATNRQGEQQESHRQMEEGSLQTAPFDQTPSTGYGDFADMDGLFDGFDWSLFDASLFELDDGNVKDLFEGFDSW